MEIIVSFWDVIARLACLLESSEWFPEKRKNYPPFTKERRSVEKGKMPVDRTDLWFVTP